MRRIGCSASASIVCLSSRVRCRLTVSRKREGRFAEMLRMGRRYRVGYVALRRLSFAIRTPSAGRVQQQREEQVEVVNSVRHAGGP